MTSFHILLFATAVLYHHYSAHAADFCVADLTLHTPNGYACKNPDKVTVDDFVFTGLTKPVNTSNPNKASIFQVSAQQFPGLNGLGLAVGRADFQPGGVRPLHYHPAATEVVFLLEGTVTMGFIFGVSNKVYTKKLNKGEVMIIPQGMLHFSANTGVGAAWGVSAFSSPEPGIQYVSSALFGNDLPSFLVEKTTDIGDAEVKIG